MTKYEKVIVAIEEEIRSKKIILQKRKIKHQGFYRRPRNFKNRRLKPLIILNPSYPIQDKILTLLHELGHHKYRAKILKDPLSKVEMDAELYCLKRLYKMKLFDLLVRNMSKIYDWYILPLLTDNKEVLPYASAAEKISKTRFWKKLLSIFGKKAKRVLSKKCENESYKNHVSWFFSANKKLYINNIGNMG